MIHIDARGHKCPIPSLRLRRALMGVGPGIEATLLATDPMARIDIPFLMAEMAGRVTSVVEDAGTLTFKVVTGTAQED